MPRPLLVVIICLCFGFVEAMQYYIGARVMDRPIPLADALMDLLSWLLLAALVFPVMWVAQRVTLLAGDSGPVPRRNWVIHAATGALFVSVHLTGTVLAYTVWMRSEVNAMEIVGQFRAFFTLDFLTYCAIVGAYQAIYHHHRAIEKAQENERLQGQLTSARLASLKRQLQPHFLFNTLNAVSSLALRGERDTLVETLGRLADLLRISLDDNLGDQIPLRREVELLDRFLAIQDVRFGDRLEVKVEIDPETTDLLVPTLFLQPIVENALEHGVTRVPGKATVSVQSWMERGKLVLEVTDNGPGFDKGGRTANRGIGLDNTRDRLHTLFGDNAELETGSGRGARVTIRLPALPASRIVAAGAS